jgi:predicted amidohydrolase
MNTGPGELRDHCAGIATRSVTGRRLERIERLLAEASVQGAQIACLPEPTSQAFADRTSTSSRGTRNNRRAQSSREASCRTYHVAVILSLELVTGAGRQIAACVIDADGNVQGYQTKNQLDPSEDRYYVAGTSRRLFEIDGVRFGVVICHEGWRYPESVRWAAARGAKIVFHPQHTGNEQQGLRLTEWGAASNPYYERAMMMRSIENTIWFASVNYALRYQEAATSLIDPSGMLRAHLPYGHEGVLVQSIDVEAATGLLAARFAPERYPESLH